MSFPNSDVFWMIALAAVIAAGLATWWSMTRRSRIRYALEAIPQITMHAPKPANECEEEPAPESGVQVRAGARLRAVE